MIKGWQQGADLLLAIMLVSMLVLEPILWCMNDDNTHGTTDYIFWEHCRDAKDVQFSYSFFSMIAMMLYYILLLDLAVISTKVSAYCLVCIRMLSEVQIPTLTRAKSV